MRFIDRLSFSADLIIKKIVRNIVLFVVLSACFFTIIVSRYSEVNLDKYEYMIKECVKVPIENTAIMRSTQVSGDVSTPEFYKKLHDDEDYIGGGSAELVEYNGLMVGRYEGFSEALDASASGDFEIIYCEYDLLSVCNTELDSGYILDSKESERMLMETVGVYLGANFNHNIPIGTVFKDTEGHYDRQLMGYFKKGASIIREDVAYGNSGDDNAVEWSLDDKIVIAVYNDYGFASDKNIIASRIPATEFREKVKQYVNESEGVDVVIVTVEERLQDMRNKNKAAYAYYDQLFIILMIVSIILIMCFQLLSIAENRKLYGIFLTNGCDTKDIIWIMLIETIIKFIFSFAIAMIVGFLVLSRSYINKFDESIIKVFKHIFFIDTIPLCTSIAVIVMAIGIIPPALMIRKKDINYFIKA